MNKKAFNKRAFISFLTFAGFLVMGITGIILFITPAGRIAYWTNWTFAGLTKTQWGNIHIVSSLLFLIAGILHTWMNWKPLMGYIRNKVKGGIRFSWELGITLCILFFIVVGAALEIPPLGSFLGFNEFVKESWIASESHEPPFGHAEMLSLKGFARKMDIDPNGAVEALQSSGIRIDSVDDALEDIARENKTSPKELYLIIRHLEKPDNVAGPQAYTAEMIEEKFAGSGIGQKTLGQVCAQLGLDCSAVRKKLGQKGIGMSERDKIKDSASQYNMNPLDLMKIIAVE